MQSLGIITPEITRPVGGEFGNNYLPELQGLPELQFSGPLANEENPGWYRGLWALAATASMAASLYHGYKRNDSLGWGLWWGLMGAIFPVVTPAVAIAQGFAKRKR